MMDGLAGLAEGFVSASPVFSTTASLVAVLAFLAEFVRGRTETKSFRPTIGWAVAVLSSFSTTATVLALLDKQLSPLSPDGYLLGVVLFVSVSMIVIGICIAVLTPSADRGALHEVASAVEAAVLRSEADDNFAHSNYVQLGLVVSNELAWSGATKESNVRALSAARLPTASVSVLAGPTGSGKSVELRHYVLALCRRAMQSRRPAELAVYVSVRRLPPIEGRIIQDTISQQLKQAVCEENTVLGDKFERYLGGDIRGPRWLFVFDLDGELAREQEEEYFQAVRNFMRQRNRDRALIAVRNPFPDTQPVFTPRTPSLRRVRELLRKNSVSELRGDLIRDLSLNEIFASPAAITQFGAHILNTGVSPRSLQEILDVFIAARLNRHSALNQSSESLRDQAESVAFRLTLGTADLPVRESDFAPLLIAQLGRIEGGVFVFRFPLLRTHLAAAYLVRNRPSIALEDLVHTEVTRQVLVAALQRSDDDFKDAVLSSVEELVRTTMVIPQDVDSAALPPLGTFSWPPVVLHALGVIRDAMRLGGVMNIQPRLRAMVDHLAWQGVFGGGRRDREAASSLLVMASQERVLALHRQAISLEYDPRTTSLIAEHLSWDPANPLRIGLWERIVILINAMKALDNHQYRQMDLPKHDGLLSLMMRDFIAIGTVSACGVATMMILLAINAPGLPLAFSVVSLLVWLSIKAIYGEMPLVGRVVMLAGVLFALCSLVVLLVLLIGLFAFNLSVPIISLLMFWAFSWPIAMAFQIVHAPHGHRHWLLPHRVVTELLAHREGLAHYADLLGRHFGPEPRWWIVARQRKRSKGDAMEVTGRLVFGGAMTSQQLLAELAETAKLGHADVTKLLKLLAAAPAGVLHASVRLLDSLDKLLEFLERTSPSLPGNTPIKPGLWRYAPDLCSTDLIEWAKTFDRKHTGFLVRLANSDQDRALLSRAIENATA